MICYTGPTTTRLMGVWWQGWYRGPKFDGHAWSGGVEAAGVHLRRALLVLLAPGKVIELC